MRKMHGTGGVKKIKKASKKAVKQHKESKKKAPTRRHGKPMMEDDPRKAGRKTGYATTGTGIKAKYKYKKKKATSTASKRSTRKKMY